MLAKNGILALRRAKRRNMERYITVLCICQVTACVIIVYKCHELFNMQDKENKGR